MNDETDLPLLDEESCERRRLEKLDADISRASWSQRSYLVVGLLITNIIVMSLLCILLSIQSPQKALSIGDDYHRSYIESRASLTMQSRPIDGALFSVYQSRYKDYITVPSPEVDAKWNVLSAEGHEVILLDGRSVMAAGYNLSRLVKAPPSWILGEMYPVQIDVFHQIHCLDEIRKQMHAWHYYPGLNSSAFDDFESTAYAHWQHKNHCLSILLQNIMCHADLDILPHRWVEELSHPFAQFSTNKQCLSFEALLSWNREQALDDIMDKWRTIQRPNDAYVWSGYGEALDTF